LQAAIGTVTQTAVTVLKECLRKVMAGQIPPGSCTSVNATSDPGGSVAAATSALQAVITDDCAETGHSPSDFGYDACPAPCDAIVLATCAAGMTGNPCARDHDCDTAPAANDGVCGAWSTVASCATCQAAAAGVAAIERAYGSSGPGTGLPALVQNCQNRIGDSVASLLAVDLKDVAKCQKDLDEFKVLLSERTPKCKDADRKAKRAKARQFALLDLASACSNAALAQLDSCATNLAGLGKCVPRIAARATAAVIDAAAPEGRCGDGQVAFGEKCDDGNTLDSDGCDSNCKPTGCGNGVISIGEQCDDENLIAGDGCDPTCQAEPQTCAPQMCSTYTFDCSTLFPGDCVCARTAEGQGMCANNFNCATAATCLVSGDCAPGERCYQDTCCGPGPTGRCGPATCTGQPE
jgi:cysteine-rich repeat protein